MTPSLNESSMDPMDATRKISKRLEIYFYSCISSKMNLVIKAKIKYRSRPYLSLVGLLLETEPPAKTFCCSSVYLSVCPSCGYQDPFLGYA